MKAREAAVDIVFDVMERGAYTAIAIDRLFKNTEFDQRDKRQITEMVNGTIRMIKHLDWVLNLFLRTPVEKAHPVLRNVLRVTLYQILFMEGIPAYASIDDAVKICKRRINNQLARVCNGVMRAIIRNLDNLSYPPLEDPVHYLGVYYSHPEWIVEKYIDRFGFEGALAILQYNNSRPILSMRCNRTKVDRDTLACELAGQGVKTMPSPLIPDALRVTSLGTPLEDTRAYRQGWFYIQNEASMLAAYILDPLDHKVYDLCCGVGGKTSHIAEMMKNRGNICAFDRHAHKIRLLEKNCLRLGLDGIEGSASDLLEPQQTFDPRPRVLLDAPCSGLGVLNRRSDLRWKIEPAQIKDLVRLQSSLLQQAGRMVAADGVLIYSTCTVNEEENEAVVGGFLEGNHDFKLEGFLNSIRFFPLDHEDQEAAESGMLAIQPGKYHTDGMFYARMRRA